MTNLSGSGRPSTTPITVIDAIMGAGKTTFAIDRMNELHAQNHSEGFLQGRPGDRKFLYVTPLLSEVTRVQEACPDLRLKDPVPVHGKKLYHLERLIDEGENVATTHALFSLLTQKVYAGLRAQNYTLVIDEVLTCCDHFGDLSPSDKALLFAGGFVFIEEGTSRLRWNHGKHSDYRGKFDKIRDLCDNGNLVVYRPKASDAEPVVILWQFPAEFLQCFSAVYILTYLFHGSPMKSYLEAEGLSFDMQSVSDGKLVPWEENSEKATKEKLRQLVTIYEGRLNGFGQSKTGRDNPLSSSWFKRAKLPALDQIKQSVASFFKLHAKTPAALNAWTTFKGSRSKLRGKGFNRDDSWIPINAKATNDYIEKRSLAYVANRFNLPVIKGYFEDRGIKVSDDVYALSEMIQWIWRSGIRRGDPIVLFVPSDRMRRLLKLWLAADDTVSFIRQAG